MKAEKNIQQAVYSFIEHNRTKDTVEIYPRKVLIVEGILILVHPDIREIEMFDIKIYVHADNNEHLIRV